jgi:hypothetical protein
MDRPFTGPTPGPLIKKRPVFYRSYPRFLASIHKGTLKMPPLPMDRHFIGPTPPVLKKKRGIFSVPLCMLTKNRG